MDGDLKDLTSGQTDPEHNPRRWIALGVIGLAQLMVILDSSIVNIALPSAQRALHISDVNRQWAVTAYTLAFGGLLLLGGRIADYFGRKRTFMIGLAGFAAASALGGFAQSAGMLFVARALQGAFAAMLAPAALSLITVSFTESKERARAFGVYGAITGGGVAVGLILGGILTQYASWRWCLFVNVPIAVTAMIAATFYVHESKAEGNTRYDVPGAVLVTGGLVSLVYGFTEAAKQGVGWGDPKTLGFLGLALVLLVGFVLVESRVSNPLLPLRVVLDRYRGGSYLGTLFVAAGSFSMFLFLTYYFQINLGYSPLKAGFGFLPLSAGIIVTASVVSRILPQTGPKPLMVLGSLLATGGIFSLVFISDSSAWVSTVLPAELLISIGMGMVFVPLASVSLYGVPPHDAGVASAVFNATQQVGGSLGIALLTTFYASAVTGYLASHAHLAVLGTKQLSHQALIHGYHVAFTIDAGLLLAAAVTLGLLVNARRDRPTEPAISVAAPANVPVETITVRH
jgi:EmrB/QacA subfamily drug resistance transporter